MNKKLITPIVAISAVLATSVGTTFALFTSKASSQVEITAGKVNVTMDIDNLETFSGVWDETTASYKIEETPVLGTFVNGGTVTVDDGVVTIDKISPMDEVKFTVTFTNNSNIMIKYRTLKQLFEDNGLFEGLYVTINGVKFDGMTDYSAWTLLSEAGVIDTYNVDILFPEEAGNEYQEKNAQSNSLLMQSKATLMS